MAVELKVLGPIPIIEKNLGGAEDFLLGDGTVTQTRNGQEVSVTRFGAGSIPWSGVPEDNNVVSIREHLESIYLGAWPEDPLVDNLGNPLVEGAMYLNTTLVPPRTKTYTTSDGWVTNMGVTSLNGQEGPLNVATIGGNNLLVNGNIPVATIGGNNLLVNSNIPVATINGETVLQTTNFALAPQSDVDALYEAVANLAVAQGSIINEATPALAIGTTAQILPFQVQTPSSNNGVISFDALANTITFGENLSYNFMSSITLDSAVGFPVQITFNLVNVADNSVVTTQTVLTDIPSGRPETIPLNTLLVVGAGTVPAAPLTIRVEAVADLAGYTLVQFNSILAASGGAAAILPSQATHAGEFLTTDGTNTSWTVVNTQPFSDNTSLAQVQATALYF